MYHKNEKLSSLAERRLQFVEKQVTDIFILSPKEDEKSAARHIQQTGNFINLQKSTALAPGIWYNKDAQKPCVNKVRRLLKMGSLCTAAYFPGETPIFSQPCGTIEETASNRVYNPYVNGGSAE